MSCTCSKHRRQNQNFFAKMKYRYGVTKANWYDALRIQAGRCAICSRELQQPVIDHCHNTGIFRGLLCQGCNLGLGAFHDSPGMLQAAARYLG